MRLNFSVSKPRIKKIKKAPKSSRHKGAACGPTEAWTRLPRPPAWDLTPLRRRSTPRFGYLFADPARKLAAQCRREAHQKRGYRGFCGKPISIAKKPSEVGFSTWIQRYFTCLGPRTVGSTSEAYFLLFSHPAYSTSVTHSEEGHPGPETLNHCRDPEVPKLSRA